MVYLRHWFNCFFILILYTTANTQTVISISPTPNSTAPHFFPQEPVNGTEIRTANSTLNSLNNTQNTNTNKNESINLNLQENINTTTTNKTDDKSTNSKVNVTNIEFSNTNPHIQPRSNNVTTTKNNDTIVNMVAKNATYVNKTIPTNHTNNDSSNTDTELEDLNEPTVPCLDPKQIPDTPPIITYNFTQGVNKETELIEDGQNTEDILRNSSLREGKLSTPGVPLVQGQLAAILAGVFVAVSIIAYLGLLSWRRYLENRYGNRQMLVNEDEFNDDLRHFSI